MLGNGQLRFHLGNARLDDWDLFGQDKIWAFIAEMKSELPDIVEMKSELFIAEHERLGWREKQDPQVHTFGLSHTLFYSASST